MSYILSKSSYIKGLQCPKALYLYKHHYQLKDPVSAEQQAIFNRGHEVGKMAQTLFPGGIDVSPPSPRYYKQAIQKTTELIAQGQLVIYEAALVGLNTLIYNDILVKSGNEYHLYEVKSSLKLSKTYYQDTALQYTVAKASGINVTKAFLVNINSNYILEEKLNIHDFFNITEVTEYCISHEEEIKQNIKELITVLQQSKMPDVKIGNHCNSPYPCDFKGTCWKDIAADSILFLNSVDIETQEKWKAEGIEKIDDIREIENLKEHLRLQIISKKTNSAIIDEDKIKEFINGLQYPLTFFDIESAMPAIPKYKGTSPFHLLPGIFSSIILNEDGSKKENFWIHEDSSDPRLPFIKALLKTIPPNGDLLVYDIQSEKNILKRLSADFPEHANELKIIMQRMKDIAMPFSEKWYYHPLFNGGYSLKAVCKHVLKTDLFDKLTINNGALAMHSYEQLPGILDIFEKAKILEDLKEYSLADVRALILLLNFFKSI